MNAMQKTFERIRKISTLRYGGWERVYENAAALSRPSPTSRKTKSPMPQRL